MRLLLTLTTAHALLPTGQARRPVAGGLLGSASVPTATRSASTTGFVCASTRRGAHACVDSAASASASNLRPPRPWRRPAVTPSGASSRRRRSRTRTLRRPKRSGTSPRSRIRRARSPVWAGFAASKDAHRESAGPAGREGRRQGEGPAGGVEFYTTGLGMTLLRQRALVPDEAALAGVLLRRRPGPESAARGAPRAALRLRLGEGRARRRDQWRATSVVVRDPRRHHGRHGRQPGGRVPAHGPGRLRGPRRRGRRCCKGPAQALKLRRAVLVCYRYSRVQPRLVCLQESTAPRQGKEY